MDVNMIIKKGYIVHGHGPVIVLLHSSMSSKEQWKPLIKLLHPRFRLIAIDLSGYGDNELPQSPQTFSTDDEISLIDGILKKETSDDEPFHLVGHSYGGAIALKFTLKRLARVRTLTLFEPVAFHLLPPGGPAHNEIRTVVKRLTRAMDGKDKTSATQIFIDYWSGHGTFEQLNSGNQITFIQYIDKVMLDFQALFNESSTLKDYSTIWLPICMIKGEQSPLSSLQIFAILEQHLPHHSIHSVPGGHMSPLTHVNKVNKIIENFLVSYSSKQAVI